MSERSVWANPENRGNPKIAVVSELGVSEARA